MNRQTLSHHRELRGLELFVARPTRVVEALIASATPVDLQRIVFSTQVLTERLNNSDFTNFRDAIDGLLCQLEVDRLRGSGYKSTPGTQLLAGHAVGPDFKEFLRNFREKGRVRIVRMPTGRTVYDSDA